MESKGLLCFFLSASEEAAKTVVAGLEWAFGTKRGLCLLDVAEEWCDFQGGKHGDQGSMSTVL